MSEIQVVVVTPEQTALDVTAEFLVLPLFDGEMGVLQGHAPTIGRLGFGEMRVRDKKGTESYYVDGGFAQIADNVVSVLTGRVIPASKLDKEEIRQRLHEQEAKQATTPDEIALRQRALEQAKAQLRIATKA